MLFSEPATQLKLHKEIRAKIPEWKCEAELTCHPSAEPSYIQAILDLRQIKRPPERTCEVSQEVINQISKRIMEFIETLRSKYEITKISMRDHEVEMDKGRREKMVMGLKYYNGLPNEEIQRVCSVGTRIALGILSMLEERRTCFKDDPDLRGYVDEQVRNYSQLLVDKYRIDLAWHEVCVSLGIWGNYSYYKRGFLDEEHTFMRSVRDDGLKLIIARSLDCKGVCTDWKGRLFDCF